MKNVSKPLVTGYFNLLNNMVVEGETVTFHHLKAPYPTEYPYILLSGITSFNNNTKDSFNGETVVDLHIYTFFAGDYGSMDLADAIAEELLQRVIPEPAKSGVLAAGFKVAGAKLRGMRDFEDEQEGFVTYGKRITIEHIIFQI